MKFKRVKLKEIGEIVGGGTPSTKNKSYYGGNISWITPKDLSKNKSKYIYRGERNITYEGLINSSAKILPKGTVLFSSRAPIGYVAIAAKDLSTNQGFKSIVPGSEIDNEFLYYLLIHNRDTIKNLGSGSTFKEVSGKTMKNIEVLLPEMDVQLKISLLLSLLDKKIEVNNKIIANLEEQAQAIFKSWFVDFEPFQDGNFVESELGMIPEGWEVKELGDFIPVVTGKKNANIANDNGEYPFFTCSQEIFKTDDYSFDANAILLAGNGDFNVKRYNGKFEAYQRTYVLIPKNEKHVGWLYNLIKYFLRDIVSGYKGSVINYITKGMIENFKIAVPRNIDELNVLSIFNDFELMISNINNENKKLAGIRDALLPKLMSGEIDVSNIKIKGEEVKNE